MKPRKYESYTYEITPIEVVKSSSGEHEEYITGYEYTIYTNDDPYHSDEWYETANEAEIAAEDMIDKFMDGLDEPDYDVQPYGVIDWEERRRMGE